MPHGSPECDEPDVAMCVCDFEPRCCSADSLWDAECVDLVDVLGCGDCGQSLEDCCTPHNDPICDITYVSQCVCDLDPVCCGPGGVWDLLCVALAASSCGAVCPPLEGDCCVEGEQAGCEDYEVVACVCMESPFCCEFNWGQVPCTELANECEAKCGG